MKSLSDRQRFFLSLAFFVATLAVILLASNRSAAPTFVTPSPAQVMTLDPQIVANVENRDALRLDEATLAAVQEISGLVDDCPDYGEERRNQMKQHVAWLGAPDTIPADILLAIGENPMGRLVVGMATYTAVQWRLNGQPADSCLLTIGRKINPLLIVLGEDPLPEFDGP